MWNSRAVVLGQGGMTTTTTKMCQTLRRTSRLPPRPNRSFYPLALLCESSKYPTPYFSQPPRI